MERVADMKVLMTQCDWIPDRTSPKATERGDGDLVVDASDLGLVPGEAPPKVVEVERAEGVFVQFEGGGQLYHGDEFIGWTYWEEDASFDSSSDTPYVNFKILNDQRHREDFLNALETI